MANQFQVVDWMAMKALAAFQNELVIADMFTTEYEGEFEKTFAVGETVRVKYPQRFYVTEGFEYTPQPLDDQFTTVTVDKPIQVAFEGDSVEIALRMAREGNDFKSYFTPFITTAAKQMAQYVDSLAAQFAYQNANNVVGSQSTTPTDVSNAQVARQRMIELAAKRKNARAIITPAAMTAIANGGVITQFNPQDQSSMAYKEGYIGNAKGFDWFESMSIRAHTCGTWAGAVTISGAGQQGNSLLLNCTNGDTFKKGDVFTIASVNGVNPFTRTSVNSLKRFVITSDVTATGATVTIPIQAQNGANNAIVGPGGQYQTVDALPGDTAALTLMPGTASPNGTTGMQGLAMVEGGFALASVPLFQPKAVEMARTMTDPDTKLSMAFVQVFDGKTRKLINRLDALFGFGVLRPDSTTIRMVSAV